jgi:hypothetical protein
MLMFGDAVTDFVYRSCSCWLESILAKHGSSEVCQGWTTKEELARVPSAVGVNVDVGWLW